MRIARRSEEREVQPPAASHFGQLKDKAMSQYYEKFNQVVSDLDKLHADIVDEFDRGIAYFPTLKRLSEIEDIVKQIESLRSETLQQDIEQGQKANIALTLDKLAKELKRQVGILQSFNRHAPYNPSIEALIDELIKTLSDNVPILSTLRDLIKQYALMKHKKPEIPLEVRVAQVIVKYPDTEMRSLEIAKLLNLSGKSPDGQVRGTRAWKNSKELRSGARARKGHKISSDSSGGHSNTGERSDVDASVGEPKPEHLDINEMIKEYQCGKRTKYPTPEDIIEKLSTSDDIITVPMAKELLKETEGLFGYDL